MNSKEVERMFKVCLKYGGSFYSRLGEAALYADENNKALIIRTFPRIETVYGPGTNLFQNFEES